MTGSDPSIAVSCTKDLEDWDGVVDLIEPWVRVDGLAIVHPPLPMVIGGCGTSRNDSGTDRFLNSAEVSAERICGRRWQSVHKDG